MCSAAAALSPVSIAIRRIPVARSWVIASRAPGRIWSAKLIVPTTVPSRATQATVAVGSCSGMAMWLSVSNRWLPTRTDLPSTVAATPRPSRVSNAVGSATTIPAAVACSTTASASGCPERRSAAAANVKMSCSVKLGSRTVMVSTFGSPMVNVPVLSNTMVSTWARASRWRPPLTKMPLRAARAIAAIITIGVARPSSAGEVKIIKVTTLRTSRVAMNTITRNTTTTGINQAATLSARRWIGAWDASASSTRATIRAKVVSLPARSVRMSKAPACMIVPANTAESCCLSFGVGSPVIDASSTAAVPVTTTPSTGICSPARTRITSPGRMVSMSTTRSPVESRSRAVRGTVPIRPLIEARARSVFRSAMNSASRMIVINTAPATASPPINAKIVANVTNISVPILCSWTRSERPVLASGYSPTATVAHNTPIGTQSCA